MQFNDLFLAEAVQFGAARVCPWGRHTHGAKASRSVQVWRARLQYNKGFHGELTAH
jgi:hypothetical protein